MASCRTPSQHPPGCPPTHRYEVCFLNASPRSFSSRVSCSMSGRLLNVSLHEPAPASSEPAPDSESPPSAPREAGRPPKPPTAAGPVRSFAWGSMLVGVSAVCRPGSGPPSPVSTGLVEVGGDTGESGVFFRGVEKKDAA
ncbi:hypothetical protein EYF80_038837 [Liparis tanakae]|uniref:Uncharacterized protein n=1 Tax=Liparis tanakae TaxID=230148 RepID=A0A4Z2GE19_9TELE|nr:hypothetical protein EYF80_038837 [Liparis tanakae]